MENCKATNEPDSYEAVDYEKIREDISFYGFPNGLLFIENIDPRKHKHIYAQDGCSCYKHEEEPIVTLQTRSRHDNTVSF